jgi:serine-type D-Ala-D-Ala carboxypeptidase (penicillin-binding protein 5/6)
MLNILLTLILPFIPVWMYGNFTTAVHDTQTASCDSSQSTFCFSGQKVLGEEDQAKTGDGGDSSSGFNNFNILPIDQAQAYGFVPQRIGNFSDIKLWAGSSVAIDTDSGTILHYENGRTRTQIASLTKMMTAVLAMEKISNLNEEITVTKEALRVDGTVVGCPTSTFCNGNRMYVGEKVKAIDLLKAMLMNSANDAATALGIHMAGSANDFVNMMNDRAKDLGLTDTHFCTPSGLEIDGEEDQCYSSAYDIARIASYSLKYDKIWDIMKIDEGQFYSTDGKYMHELKNTDLLLDTLPNCIGGKTGFTPLAGKSLLLGATDPSRKHKIIAVVLNDEKRWDDMKFLVDWVYQNYKWQ